MIQVSDAFIAKMIGPVATLYARVELLDKNENVIDRIDSLIIEGNISVDKQRDIRRQFSITLDNTDGSLTWSPGGRIWLDKRVKFYIGLETDAGIEYVPQGVFLLTEPMAKSAADGTRQVTLQGSDKWALFDGEPLGRIENDLEIASGTSITGAITMLLNNVEAKIAFDTITQKLDRTLHYNIGEPIGKAIKELAGLALCDLYYDVNGFLRLRKRMDDTATDPQLNVNYQPSVWTYDKNDPYTLYAGTERALDVSETYNKVLVIGGSAETATVSWIEANGDPNDPLSTANINTRLFVYNDGSPDPLITTQALAQARAKYELKNRVRITERQHFEIAPNYLHEEGDVITILDDWTGTQDKFELLRFDINLAPGGMMTCEAWKIREVTTDGNV